MTACVASACGLPLTASWHAMPELTFTFKSFKFKLSMLNEKFEKSGFNVYFQFKNFQSKIALLLQSTPCMNSKYSLCEFRKLIAFD